MLNTIAVIRETECIGCTKCIKACPVDAIVGSAKQMHTILSDLCIGCELCIAPCPVDCIDMIIGAKPVSSETKKTLSKQRFQARKLRLANKNFKPPEENITLQNKQTYVQEAILRARAKKQKC